MNRSTLFTSIQHLQLRKETLLRELESLDLDLMSQQAQYSQLVNDDAIVYRLPNELLTGSSRISPPALPFQVVASHVSHRWREIALGTPLLWNTLSFTIRPMNHVNGRLISQLEAHFERSGSCFLDISLDFQISDDWAGYCHLLAKHSRRWRRLSILTKFEHVSEFREMLRDLQVPILEHLSLNFGRPQGNLLSPRQPFISVTPSILTPCPPCLSFLRLAGQALGNLHPPTSSVTTLHLDGWTRHFMTHAQFKAIMEGAPHLINLSLNQLWLHHPRDPSAIAEPTTLPSLRALRIRGPCSPVSRLMSLLDMPLLESIALESVETFHSQVMGTVRSLILNDCAFNEQETRKLIQSLPSLSDLCIDESLTSIFSVLFPLACNMSWSIEGKATPWAYLQTIAVRNLQSLDVPIFCNMVLDRLAGGSANGGGSSPLRRILLDRRSRTVLRAKLRLDSLQEKVIVENADLPAPWPMGLQYEDAHDLLE